MIKLGDSSKKSIFQSGIVLTQTMILLAAAVLIVVIGAYVLSRSHTSSKKQSTAPTKQVPSGTKTAGAAKGSQFEIKEYGVAITLPAELKGLSYKAETNPQKTFTIVNLKTDDYSALANKCSGAAKDTPQTLASLVKTNGNYDPNQIPKSQNLKQFDNFYIANLGGSQPPGVVCKDQPVQQQYNELYVKLSNALNSSFSSARLSQ